MTDHFGIILERWISRVGLDWLEIARVFATRTWGLGMHWNLRARFFSQQQQPLGCSGVAARPADGLAAHYQRQYARVL